MAYWERLATTLDNESVQERDRFFMVMLTREELRSGTCSTIRYAWSLGRPIVLVWASGALNWERFVMTPGNRHFSGAKQNE